MSHRLLFTVVTTLTFVLLTKVNYVYSQGMTVKLQWDCCTPVDSVKPVMFNIYCFDSYGKMQLVDNIIASKTSYLYNVNVKEQRVFGCYVTALYSGNRESIGSNTLLWMFNSIPAQVK